MLQKLTLKARVFVNAKSVMANSKAYWKLLQGGTSKIKWKAVEYYKVGEIDMVRMVPVLKGDASGPID